MGDNVGDPIQDSGASSSNAPPAQPASEKKLTYIDKGTSLTEEFTPATAEIHNRCLNLRGCWYAFKLQHKKYGESRSASTIDVEEVLEQFKNGKLVLEMAPQTGGCKICVAARIEIEVEHVVVMRDNSSESKLEYRRHCRKHCDSYEWSGGDGWRSFLDKADEACILFAWTKGKAKPGTWPMYEMVYQSRAWAEFALTYLRRDRDTIAERLAKTQSSLHRLMIEVGSNRKPTVPDLVPKLGVSAQQNKLVSMLIFRRATSKNVTTPELNAVLKLIQDEKIVTKFGLGITNALRSKLAHDAPAKARQMFAKLEVEEGGVASDDVPVVVEEGGGASDNVVEEGVVVEEGGGVSDKLDVTTVQVKVNEASSESPAEGMAEQSYYMHLYIQSFIGLVPVQWNLYAEQSFLELCGQGVDHCLARLVFHGQGCHHNPDRPLLIPHDSRKGLVEFCQQRGIEVTVDALRRYYQKHRKINAVVKTAADEIGAMESSSSSFGQQTKQLVYHRPDETIQKRIDQATKILGQKGTFFIFFYEMFFPGF